MSRWAVPVGALIGLAGAAIGLGVLGGGIAEGNALVAILGLIVLVTSQGLATSIYRSERRRVPSEKRNAAARPSLAPSDDGGSQLAIYRYGGYWRDASRAYQVFVDGQPVGKLREFQTLSVPVSPGVHDVQLKLSWATSPSTVVQIGQGETQLLECRPGALLGLVLPGKYVQLENQSEPHGDGV